MNDLRRIMDEGVPDSASPRKLPSIMPWAFVALALVLISLGIRLFWPIPPTEKLSNCAQKAHEQTACIRMAPVPAPTKAAGTAP